MDTNLIINICGPSTDYYDSYGKKLCELVRGLTARGVHCNVIPLNGALVRDNQPDDVQALLSRPIRPAMGGIVMGYPTIYHRYPAMVLAGPVVAVTAWESTIPPLGWVESLNRVDAVSVGSQFTHDVLKTAGVAAKKLHIHPLGISEAYQYIKRQREPDQPFTFLTIGDRKRRKGWDVALKAHYMAFGRDMRYQMIVKARAGGFPFNPLMPNVSVLREDLTEADFAALYGRADAFVFPTRGEGFGLPPREAAATGLPVIATNWSGTKDDLIQWGYPIGYALVPAWQDDPDLGLSAPAKLRGLGEWAEPDVEHLAKQMQHVAQGALVGYMAQQSARRVRKLYSWQRFADQVLDVYQQQAAKYPLRGRRAAQHRKQGRLVI